MAGKINLIFLSKKSGQRYSIQLSRAFSMIMLFLFTIIAAVLVFSLSVISMLNNRTLVLQSNIQDLELKKQKMVKNKEEAELYRQWSENLIFKQFNFTDISGRGSNVLPEARLEGEIVPGDFTPKNMFIDVENFNVNRFNLALDFDCYLDLVNRRAGRREISGYFFILARNEEVIPEIYSLWPGGTIKSGKPAAYTEGDSFSILYMKKIKARIIQPEIGPKYNRVDLIAYDDDGELLMHKGYYIEKSLVEYPLE